MQVGSLIERYAAGPAMLRQAVAGLSPEHLRAHPIAGAWSVAEVVCHLADFEPILADRMKRIIAEDEPALLGADQERYAARLAYGRRDLGREIELIELTRAQLLTVLRGLGPDDFRRVGRHNAAGPMTLESLLAQTCDHLDHHLKFVAAKRHALGVPTGTRA